MGENSESKSLIFWVSGLSTGLGGKSDTSLLFFQCYLMKLLISSILLLLELSAIKTKIFPLTHNSFFLLFL